MFGSVVIRSKETGGAPLERASSAAASSPFALATSSSSRAISGWSSRRRCFASASVRDSIGLFRRDSAVADVDVLRGRDEEELVGVAPAVRCIGVVVDAVAAGTAARPTTESGAFAPSRISCFDLNRG